MSEVRRIPGLGTIYLRDKRYWVGYSVNGRWKRESAHADTEKAAVAFLKRRLAEIHSGSYVGAAEKRLRFDDLQAMLEADYRQHERRSLVTLRFRFRNLRAFFGLDRAHQITAARINDYREARLAAGAARATIDAELHALSAALRIARELGRTTHRPLIKFFRPKNARKGFIEPTALESIVRRLPDEARDPVRFLYLSGCRIGEMCSLRWADVDLDAREIRFRGEAVKTGESRLLPLAGDLLEVVARQARALAQPYLFSGPYGRKLTRDWIERRFRRAARDAGLGHRTPHDLRRSFARNMDRAGMRQSVIMALMGHRTAAMFTRYRIVPDEELRDSVEAAMTSGCTQNVRVSGALKGSRGK